MLSQGTANDRIPSPMRSHTQDKIKELCKILEPLKVLTDRLQSDGLTINIVILSIITTYRGTILNLQTDIQDTN